MNKNCDVLIIGAGTSGVYFGWLMAKKGYSVLIIDKDAREKVDERLEIIHFVPRVMEELDIPFPKKDPEYLFMHRDIAVSRLPLFLQRMYKIMESDGAKFEFSCVFQELIYENGRIIGAKVKKGDGEHEVKARLVVDASGIACAVRSTLPDDYGVDNWKYDATRMFYVILYYIRWEKPDEPHPKVGDIIPSYFQFFDPGYGGDQCIMGIAVPNSFKKADKYMNEIIEKYNYPPFELIKKEYNYFPLSYPPYSLVGDGFFCIGDSASIINPLAARGIVETWQLIKNVEDVFDAVLKKDDYLTQEALWEVNVKNFRDEGAELAYVMMLASFVHYLPEEELNFLFEYLRPIIEPELDDPDAAHPEEFKLSIGMIIKVVFKVLGALLRRKVSFKSLRKTLKVNKQANTIKKHYKKFPENPKDFDEWVSKADELWSVRKLPAPPSTLSDI